MEKPNATLTIEGTHASVARFTCDHEIALKEFESTLADISVYGAYATLVIQPQQAGSLPHTQDCKLSTGVTVDWQTWFDIGSELSRRLGINITM